MLCQLSTMTWLIGFVESYAWKLVYGTVLLTGILINALLLIILFQKKSQRKSYFSLVRSLIFADMLLPLSSALLYFLIIWFDFIIPFIHDVYEMVYQLVLYIILLHLMILAAEHYVAIIQPLHYINWTRRRYIVIRLLIVWLCPIVLVIIGRVLPNKSLYVVNDWSYEYYVNNTDVAEEMSSNSMDTFRIPFVLVCFLVMAFVYIYIYQEVWKQQRLQQTYNASARNNHRALLTTILNLISFVICWLPPVGIEIWFQFSNPAYFSEYVHNIYLMKQVVPSIVYLNSICDPLIYALRLSDIKMMWKRRFCDCCSLSRISLQRQIKNEDIEIVYNDIK